MPVWGTCNGLARLRIAQPHARQRRCQAASTAVTPSQVRLEDCAAQFLALTDARARLGHLIELGSDLPEFPNDQKTRANQVMGCASQVWLTVDAAGDGTVSIAADSDSQVSRGLAAILIRAFHGSTPDEILDADIAALDVLDLGAVLASPSRVNSFRNMFETLRKRARALAGDVPQFPFLRISHDRLEPRGAFAEAQAQFLQPDLRRVQRLAAVLATKQIGVVAHFYMDPEVQGVLTSARNTWPHIAVSDSLVMADTAVAMARKGCKHICVLGVDFMSENVRAVLDEAGYGHISVFRMDAAEIGCSLAEAAESELYSRYLRQASEQERSLHVIYINTSLRTKALAHAQVPTITCTSSNVVRTVLQAFAQVPDLHVWYGPDTYMGRNLQQLFESLAELPDDDVRAVHPQHTAASIRALLPRLHHFQDGTCIVHHIFGGETCELVRKGYSDAYITAHFEVPGEMFTLAMKAQRERGMGIVGSTSNILSFITSRVEDALALPHPQRLQFVLGTESGMITSIVRRVQSLLREGGEAGERLEVDIVFPVAPQSITTADTAGASAELPGGLAVVPGPAAGEGCSLEGGCAACPYMRMNTLDALTRVCDRISSAAGEALLEAHRPRSYDERVDGMSLAEAGCVPILHMRDFQQDSVLSEALVEDIKTRKTRPS